MRTEKRSSKEINQMIDFAIARGEVRAVDYYSVTIRGCVGCVFRNDCEPAHDRICMAHNRDDRRSVYFINAGRDNDDTGTCESMKGV